MTTDPVLESQLASIRKSIPLHISYEEKDAREWEGVTFTDGGVSLGELGDRGAFRRKVVEKLVAKSRARAEFLNKASISDSEADLLKAGRLMMDPYLDPADVS